MCDLRAGEGTRVCDGERDAQLTIGVRDGELGEGESGVGEAVTKGKVDVLVGELVVAVSDVDVLAVEGAAGLGAVVEEGRVVLQALREAERQLARGVVVAKDDVGDGVAGLVAAVPGLEDGRSSVEPGHLLGGAGLHDDDGVGVGGGDLGDELVQHAGELHAGAVGALRLPVGVEAGADDDLVVLLGESYGFLDLGLVIDDFAAADAERAVAGNDGVALERVRRGRAELNLEVVRLALGEVDAARLLARGRAKEGVAGDLVRGVIDDELVVDVGLCGAADDEADLVGAVLVGGVSALHVGVPRVRRVGVVVVHQVHVRLGEEELVDVLPARGSGGLVEDSPAHALSSVAGR